MSNRHVSYFELGASLYTPCNHPDLLTIVQRGITGARSMVFCLEDAIRDDEVAFSLANLNESLRHLNPDHRFRRFIRPRNPNMLVELLKQPHVHKVDGFVLPKADLNSLPQFKAALENHAKTPFALMPTLETEQIFDAHALTQIRTQLLEWRAHIPCLRIGGGTI